MSAFGCNHSSGWSSYHGHSWLGYELERGQHYGPDLGHFGTPERGAYNKSRRNLDGALRAVNVVIENATHIAGKNYGNYDARLLREPDHHLTALDQATSLALNIVP